MSTFEDSLSLTSFFAKKISQKFWAIFYWTIPCSQMDKKINTERSLKTARTEDASQNTRKKVTTRVGEKKQQLEWQLLKQMLREQKNIKNTLTIISTINKMSLKLNSLILKGNEFFSKTLSLSKTHKNALKKVRWPKKYFFLMWVFKKHKWVLIRRRLKIQLYK